MRISQWVLENIPKGPLLVVGDATEWEDLGYSVNGKNKVWLACISDSMDGYRKDIINIIKEEGIPSTDDYDALHMKGYSVLITRRLPNSHKGDVTIFADGGLGNRMSQILTGMVAGQLYGRKVVLHWIINEHMGALPWDLFNIPVGIVIHTDQKKFNEMGVVFNRGWRAAQLKPYGVIHFGSPKNFLIQYFDPRFRYHLREQLSRITPSEAVKKRMINLEGTTAYTVRTLSHYHSKDILKIPDGSFLTTESLEQVRSCPKCINVQTIFDDKDFGEHRKKEGMIEAVSDWFSMFSCDEIVYNALGFRTCFTNVHGQLLGIKRTYYYDKIKPPNDGTIHVILTNHLLKSKMFMALKKYLQGATPKYKFIENTPKKEYMKNFHLSRNLITWGVKLNHQDYTRGDKNILYIENGLLNQRRSTYLDHVGYFADSSLVVNSRGQAPFTEDELKNTRDYILDAVGADILSPQVDKNLPLLVCLQMNGDAPMKHYFPGTRGTRERTARFLKLIKKNLKTDRKVIIRTHPKEPKMPKLDFELPSNWVVDSSTGLYEALRGCSGVISVNSTCVVEALCYGLPVATFGTSIFSNQDLTVDCSTKYDKVNEIFDFSPKESNLHSFLCSITRQCPSMDSTEEEYLEFFKANESVNHFLKEMEVSKHE